MDEILIVLIVIYYIDGLVKDWSNSIANTLEVLQLHKASHMCIEVTTLGYAHFFS